MVKIHRGFALFLWSAAICVVLIGSLSPSDSALMRTVDGLDINNKILHFSAYVCLAILPVLGIRKRNKALMAAASMVLLGLLVEFAQNLVPGRTPEVADEVANILGVASGIAIAFPFRRTLTG